MINYFESGPIDQMIYLKFFFVLEAVCIMTLALTAFTKSFFFQFYNKCIRNQI